MPLSVLVVNPDRDHLAIMAASLKASDYDPTLTDDFEDATALLKAGGFAFLVTAERLGAHNGLHLVLRARATSPTVGAVVTMSKPDQVLETEAALFGAICVVAAWEDPRALVAALVSAGSIQPT
jgi:ActR/RegA family two-component response regulator